MSDHVTCSLSRRPGLDLLRLTAASLVFFQHSLSSCEQEHWIDLAGFRNGRIGTALFFLLAGYLAASSRRSPVAWFRDRLSSLLPTFWLVTLLSFLIAGVTGIKSFDLYQVVCQLGCVGYFTHGEHMVNVATWFMSPLLLLYAIAVAARLISPPAVAGTVILALACAASLPQDVPPTVLCHAVTFLTAFIIGRTSTAGPRRATLWAVCFLAGLTVIQPEFRYGTVAMLLLAVALPFRFDLPAIHTVWSEVNPRRWFFGSTDAGTGKAERKQGPEQLLSRFAGVAYEWFLIHGLCINLIALATDQVLVVVPVGMVLSLLAATALKLVVQQMKERVSAWVSPSAMTAAHPVSIELPAAPDISALVPYAAAASLLAASALPTAEVEPVEDTKQMAMVMAASSA
jgi:hypothetical protein